MTMHMFIGFIFPQLTKITTVPMLENPAQSPDLNPIWLAIKRKLPSNTSNSVDELHEKKIRKCSLELCQSLYASVQKRVRRV